MHSDYFNLGVVAETVSASLLEVRERKTGRDALLWVSKGRLPSHEGAFSEILPQLVKASASSKIIRSYGVDRRGIIFIELEKNDNNLLLSKKITRDGKVFIINQCINLIARIHRSQHSIGSLSENSFSISTDNRVYLTEFIGSAAGIDFSAAKTGSVNKHYAAPEFRRQGNASPATDVYSLGALIYRITLNEMVPVYNEISGHQSFLHGALDSNLRSKSAPEWCSRIIKKCLAWDASERFSDANQLLDALSLENSYQPNTVSMSSKSLSFSIDKDSKGLGLEHLRQNISLDFSQLKVLTGLLTVLLLIGFPVVLYQTRAKQAPNADVRAISEISEHAGKIDLFKRRRLSSGNVSKKNDNQENVMDQIGFGPHSTLNSGSTRQRKITRSSPKRMQSDSVEKQLMNAEIKNNLHNELRLELQRKAQKPTSRSLGFETKSKENASEVASSFLSLRAALFPELSEQNICPLSRFAQTDKDQS